MPKYIAVIEFESVIERDRVLGTLKSAYSIFQNVAVKMARKRSGIRESERVSIAAYNADAAHIFRLMEAVKRASKEGSE